VVRNKKWGVLVSKLECMRTPHGRCQKHHGDEECWRSSSATNHHYCLHNTVCSFLAVGVANLWSCHGRLDFIGSMFIAEDSDR
jgi:hypothetical protein